MEFSTGNQTKLRAEGCFLIEICIDTEAMTSLSELVRLPQKFDPEVFILDDLIEFIWHSILFHRVE
jgi:hypothetical protein